MNEKRRKKKQIGIVVRYFDEATIEKFGFLNPLSKIKQKEKKLRNFEKRFVKFCRNQFILISN